MDLKQRVNRKNIWELILLVSGVCVLLLIYFMKISEIFNRADFQWEIREGVVFYIAKRFADGYNPYIYHDGMPEAVYMYGFILPMIISLGFKLFGTSAFLIAEIMTMLTEMVGVGLFGWIMKRSGISKFLIPYGMIAVCGCYYRFGAVAGVFPDTYGITLIILIWFIAQSDELKNRYRVLLYAVLCTGVFYVKQYFVSVALGFVLYFILKKAYKELARFMIEGSLIGASSIVLARLIFPTYFTTNTYFLGVYNRYSLEYSFSQFGRLFQVYLVLFVILFIGLAIHFIFSRFDNTSKNVFPLSQGIIMLLISGYLSTSDGTWLTYYLQLWFPFMIFWSFLCWKELRTKLEPYMKKIYFYIALCAVELAMLLALGVSLRYYVLQGRLDENYVTQWREMYDFLDSYKGKKIKVSALPLTFYCVKNDIYSDNTGHTNCYTYELLDMVEKKEPPKFIFPYARELTEQYMNYKDDSLRKCEEGYYDCIILENINYYEEEILNAIDDLYKETKEYTLMCGTEAIVCTVYTKK